MTLWSYVHTPADIPHSSLIREVCPKWVKDLLHLRDLPNWPFRPIYRLNSISFPLGVNDELKPFLKQSGYSVQLGLTGYSGFVGRV